ncbi:class II aldolase/adducin family protein [Acetobacter sp. TBRC 12305]|uniref:Class II aldolase/adducin family protein n=1 Tax=Acetobacter garciniae TaxID=2817435 RepID=A0A939HPS6_9PROT|nr:class II aldolase/adducin family protein [Acetobacter garciniae]MBO1325582.1 class II aldolase/adducin family protein [Acetobacter garciniae]MBX0345245.1 class II aldolase/adducin family protein [Acetobacter garciniae]
MSTVLSEDRPATTLNASVAAFVDTVKAEAKRAFEAFRSTGTITAAGTVGFVERVPGENLAVAVSYPGPFEPEQALSASVFDLQGKLVAGKSGGLERYASVLREHPDITSISHVHAPSLGAWAQTHRSFPFHYVPVQRFRLARELPVYIDRRQGEDDFILETLARAPGTPGIIEANGGATVWGWKGLRDLAELILLLEEGADIQIRAQAIGGSRPFGPGVLRQQWKRSGLYERAKAEHLLPATDL